MGMATLVEQVDELVKMVADENNLALGYTFADLTLPDSSIEAKMPEPEKVTPDTNNLEVRLANLRS